MGVGYSVSVLHRIAYIEPDPDSKERLDPPPVLQYFPPGTVWDGRPIRFRSPEKAVIVAWRDRVSAKYRSHLGEDLYWDEDDDFADGEDVRPSGDVLLRYVAALLDEHGEEKAARAVAGRPKPPHNQIHAALEAAEGRGFTGKFPHLLLGPTCWLPFERHTIIEEPNWEGHVTRFGSVGRLKTEIESLCTFIASSDPGATAWTRKRCEEPPDILAAAWQVGDALSRLCATAADHRLPLWWSG